MRTTKVGIIGFGKMGKIYAKELNENKKFLLQSIITKKNIHQKPNLINLFFKKNDLIIIATPIKTHFKFLKLALKNKKNVIIEKPVVQNLPELRKILKLSKNYKKKILIHHNDILNLKKINCFKNTNSLKNIKKIIMNYGNTKNSSNIQFYIDWLPHPISIIQKFFGSLDRFEIVKYKKNINHQKLKLLFQLNKLKIFVNLSNYPNPRKEVFIYNHSKIIKYDGYAKKNQKTIKALLENFLKYKKKNDIKNFYDSYTTIFKIGKLIKNY